jgi:hypothetical protein
MSCCGSLFVNLGGGGGGSVNTGVLQTLGGGALSATLQTITDQSSNQSPLQLSTTSAKILGNVLGLGAGGGVIMGAYNATIGAIWGNVTPSTSNFALGMETNFTYLNANSAITFLLGGAGGKLDVNANGTSIGGGTANGALTVKGAGANIASFRDSSNTQVISFADNGTITSAGTVSASANIIAGQSSAFLWSGRSILRSSVNSEVTFYNNNEDNFTRIQFGGITTSFPAFSFTNTPATIAAKDATGTNLIPFSAEDFTSGNLSSGTLITARPMQFGDKGTVVTGNDLGLDAQIAVEHNGSVYYIPCKTSLIV